MEEYMRNAVLSVGYIMLTLTSFIGIGDFVTLEIFNWASKNPKITDASSVVDRLMNDVTSHKKQVENAWKDINQEMIFSEISKVVPRPVLTRVLNFTRLEMMVVVLQRANTYSISTWGDGMGFKENGWMEGIVGNQQQCILLEEGSATGRGFLSF
ncbi:hypothetical protein Gogos_015753 [Gossypium gossypioides]|uniref:Terpene synthase metal-binding domain-containing protein n=1 Tax=Gossypium gossypioides TaxID=34282 RepID=A0A7J9C2N2_GOSGO|nr:hypothetical protein [Gossypium gossypioides]